MEYLRKACENNSQVFNLKCLKVVAPKLKSIKRNKIIQVLINSLGKITYHKSNKNLSTQNNTNLDFFLIIWIKTKRFFYHIVDIMTNLMEEI